MSQPRHGDGRHRHRRPGARRRVVRLHAAQPAVADVRARGVAAAGGELRDGAARPDDLEARGAMQLGAQLRRHGDRELDARRLPRLRQPADGPLRHDARHRDRHHAAARDPLQRRRRSAALYGDLAHDAGPDQRRRRRRRRGAGPAHHRADASWPACRRRCRRAASARASCRCWPRRRPSSGPASSTRGRSARRSCCGCTKRHIEPISV